MKEFSKNLLLWYGLNKRHLPWRESKDPYHVWLSEIILQQTRVNQGLPYYEKFVSEFPTIQDLADADEEKVLKLWQGLGYYSRARNLHHTAKVISNEMNGQFPNTYKELIQLKGIGDYTASAIASICFDEHTPCIDGNVYRVLSRHNAIDTPINSSGASKVFKEIATSLIDKNQPGEFNQAMMELGAMICTPKNPQCNICPINKDCLAYASQSTELYPIKQKKKPVKKTVFHYLVFLSEDSKTLVHKRDNNSIWSSLYEFPYIVSNKKISKTTISNDEILKSHKDSIVKVALYNKEPIVHKLSHIHISAYFWIIHTTELKNGVAIEKLSELPFPVLIQNFIDTYLKGT